MRIERELGHTPDGCSDSRDASSVDQLHLQGMMLPVMLLMVHLPMAFAEPSGGDDDDSAHWTDWMVLICCWTAPLAILFSAVSCMWEQQHQDPGLELDDHGGPIMVTETEMETDQTRQEQSDPIGQFGDEDQQVQQRVRPRRQPLESQARDRGATLLQAVQRERIAIHKSVQDQEQQQGADLTTVPTDESDRTGNYNGLQRLP